MSKVGYLTPKLDLGLFRYLGMEVITVNEGDSFSSLVKKLLSEDITLVFVSEHSYRQYKKEIENMDMDINISFIVLADGTEFKKEGKKRIESIIELAIGIKV